MRPEWLDAETPEETIEAWAESVRESDPEAGRKAILEAGGFADYARVLVTEFDLELDSQAQSAVRSGRFKMRPLIACIVTGVMCIIGITTLIFLHETDQGDADDRALVAGATAGACGAAVGTCQKKKKGGGGGGSKQQ